MAEETVTLAPELGSKKLLFAFWVTAHLIAIYYIYLSLSLDAPLVRLLGATPIVIVSMLPAYLWCARKVHGVPIFPLFALTYLWTYAIPFVSQHPIILTYDDTEVLTAGLTVTGFLALATLTWYWFPASSDHDLRTEMVLKEKQGRIFFFATLVIAGIVAMGITGQWLNIEAGTFSIVRAALIALSTVGLFALSYQWGIGELPSVQRFTFVAIFIFYLIAQMTSLLLVSAILAVGMVIVGFTTGRRRFPWEWVLVTVSVLGLLHMGKGTMREQYWGSDPVAINIADYPRFYAEWIGYGLGQLNETSADAPAQSIYERVSLAHLLLKVQSESPEPLPYLFGATYAVIPNLLIPRLLDPDKLAAHEGTTILNTHYGIQSRDDTETTTIGWGLLNEAYANFGVLGAAGLSLLLGAMYGWITKKTAGAPVLSLRSLVAMTFASFAVQAEFSAGVFVSALFQSLLCIIAVSLVLMDRQTGEFPQAKGL